MPAPSIRKRQPPIVSLSAGDLASALLLQVLEHGCRDRLRQLAQDGRDHAIPPQPGIERHREKLRNVNLERARDLHQGFRAAVAAADGVQHGGAADPRELRELQLGDTPLVQQRANRLAPDAHGAVTLQQARPGGATSSPAMTPSTVPSARQLGQEGPNDVPLLVGEVTGMRRIKKGHPARLAPPSYGFRRRPSLQWPQRRHSITYRRSAGCLILLLRSQTCQRAVFVRQATTTPEDTCAIVLFASSALAAIGVGVFVLQNAGVVPTLRSVWNARRDAVTREQDRAEIEKLHRTDVAATLSGDLAALANLWTDDIVRLQPGAAAEIGKRTRTAADQRRRAASPGFRAVTYVPGDQGSYGDRRRLGVRVGHLHGELRRRAGQRGKTYTREPGSEFKRQADLDRCSWEVVSFWLSRSTRVDTALERKNFRRGGGYAR